MERAIERQSATLAPSATRSAKTAKKRLARERETVAAMIRIYCRGRHRTAEELCVECRDLLNYACVRLQRCRFGEEKPTCAKCPVHCYQPSRREAIQTVMRYAGPRMLLHHPILSLLHWWDGRRQQRNPLAKSSALEQEI